MQQVFSLKSIFIFTLLTLTGCSSKPGSKTSQIKTSNQPNIVFILVDDLGWSDLGFMGNPIYETPHLNAFSKQGMVFDNAYAPAANCAPSRASIMTGLQTTNHGIYTVGSAERGKSKDRKLIPIKNKTVLADSYSTLAEQLKIKGYSSISIGKWHLGDDPRSQGFDENIGGTHVGHPKSYFSPYKNKNLIDGPKGEYLTDRLTDEALKFIRTKKEEPFFLYLPYFTVHTPLQAKDSLIKKYEQKINGDDRYNAKYGAMVENMDRNIGRIFHQIKQLGLDDNTLIIFTSDNGGLAAVSSQAPLRAGKGSYFEGGIRVPYVFKWANKISPSRSTQPVTGLDIFPTILDILDVTPKEELDGISLWLALSENAVLPSRSLFWHFPIYLQKVNPTKDQARDSLFRTRPGSVIRKGKWKLHEYFEDGSLELYNLETDLKEQTNLAGKHPQILEELYSALKTWRLKKNAPIPTVLNDNYNGK